MKPKYGNESNPKLLTRFQRKRGSIRTQYDRNGQVTRRTLECAFDEFVRGITGLQNKIANQYFWPERRKWNTIKNITNANGEIRHHISGIPVAAYRKYFLFGKYNRVNYLDNVVHALFIGMSGKGKSQTYVLPMIQSNIDAQEGMFIHDPKREIHDTVREQLEKEGYKVIVIDFVDPEQSEGWNPLDYPFKKWKEQLRKTETSNYRSVDMSEAIELVLDISKTISYQEDAQNPFWHEGAGDMIAGGAFFLMEEGNAEMVNFAAINYLYQLGASGEKKYLQKYIDKYRSPEDESSLKMDTFFSAEGVTRAGLKSTFKNKISLLTATPAIQRLLSKSTFSFNDIFNKKTAVFMVTHDEKSTYYPLVTMFIKQLYEAGIKITRDNPENKKLKVPFNMYIDEMGLLPEIKDIEAMYGAARSRGLRIYGFFQSPSQMVQKYEVEGAKIIEDNSTHVIYLGSKLQEVAEYFERMAGNEMYYNSKDKRWSERPLISAQKLKKFEKGRSLVTAVEWDPFISKLPPYSHYIFAQKETKKNRPIQKEKPKWIDIEEAYKKKQRFSFREKGASVVNFNKLSENKKENSEDDVLWDDDVMN
ncbi:MAG: type IV secretory system conjugative DNA transfer family protein [Breznakia sp.]